VASEKVSLIAGTFLSNVGLAVSDWAKQNKSCSWPRAAHRSHHVVQGHDHVFRVRPNTYEQGACSPRRRPHEVREVATIGPNYEYGKRAWETFRDRLKELKPDVQWWASTGRRWASSRRAVRDGDPQPEPDALYVSLFGSDWIAFVREARSAALRQDVRGRHPARRTGVHRPLGPEAPEGCSSPATLVRHRRARHKDFVARFTKKYDKNPVLRSLVGYVTYLSIVEAIRRRGRPNTTSCGRLPRLKVETPIGPISYRASDGSRRWRVGRHHQARRPAWRRIMVNYEYVPGEKVLPPTTT